MLSSPNWRTQPTPAGWGFATATDRQQVEAVIRRAVRSGLCRSDILAAAELTDDMDDDLFQRILRDKNPILHALLPERRPKLDYELRPRCHDRELAPKLIKKLPDWE